MKETYLHDYQRYSGRFIETHKSSGLFLDMGLGKTVSTLTAIKHLIDSFDVSRVLVIAPKRVCEDTWPNEIEKWDHLRGLRTSLILGNLKQRLKALRADADIYIINRENVVWLVGVCRGSLPFDMLVIDELSSFKNSKAKRFKALRSVRTCFDRIVGLTGTPAPNGLIDLWSQIYLLDGGERLGKTITGFREAYFTAGGRNQSVVFNYNIIPGKDLVIYKKISDICVSMRAEDYISLPPLMQHTIKVRLSDEELRRYEDFEENETLRFYDNTDLTITASNAAALSNKLLQYANGAIYDENHDVHELHDKKLSALYELIEETNGNPVLVFYTYRHDIERIKRTLKEFNPRELVTQNDIRDWNEGKIKVLLAHPASAGHGLNLQSGGHIIVWFGQTWSLELWLQANARLYRQGQLKPVQIYLLVVVGTMDEDVVKSLTGKAVDQNALIDAVKARIQKYVTKNSRHAGDRGAI